MKKILNASMVSNIEAVDKAATEADVNAVFRWRTDRVRDPIGWMFNWILR